jgi:hypothetical protein
MASQNADDSKDADAGQKPSHKTDGQAISASTPRLAVPAWQQLAAGLVPLAIGVPMALSSKYLVELVGTALALLGLYALLPLLSRYASREQTLTIRGRAIHPYRALPVLALIALAAALLWPGLLGMMVQSQDHTIHLTRAWHFVTEMLAQSGQLSGWSDYVVCRLSGGRGLSARRRLADQQRSISVPSVCSDGRRPMASL